MCELRFEFVDASAKLMHFGDPIEIERLQRDGPALCGVVAVELHARVRIDRAALDVWRDEQCRVPQPRRQHLVAADVETLLQSLHVRLTRQRQRGGAAKGDANLKLKVECRLHDVRLELDAIANLRAVSRKRRQLRNGGADRHRLFVKVCRL